MRNGEGLSKGVKGRPPVDLVRGGVGDNELALEIQFQDLQHQDGGEEVVQEERRCSNLSGD